MQKISPMKRVAAVCGRDLDELRKGAAFAIVLAVFMLLAAALSVGSGFLVRLVVREATGTDARLLADIVKNVAGGFLLGNALYGITLLPFSLIVWVFAGSLVMREKLSGNLETLLATPLSLTELWLGKTLALVAASTGVGWLSGILALIATHCVAGIMLSKFVLLVKAPALVAAFLLNPLLFSGMCGLIILLALAKDADASILPSFIIGMGAMIGIPVGVGIGAIDIGSWIFCLYQFCASVVLWFIVIVLLLVSKKETIVLSARK